MKFFKLKFFLILSFLLFGKTYGFTLGETPLSSSGENNLKNIIIKNQKDFDDYILRTGTDLSGDIVYWRNSEKIVIPKNHYYLNSLAFWFFEGGYSGSIDFGESFFYIGENAIFTMKIAGNQLGKTINGGTFVASAKIKKILDNGGIEVFKSRIQFSLLKATDIKFYNMNFYNSLPYSSHIFDLQGSHNIDISNSVFAGYGGFEELTDEQSLFLTTRPLGHPILSEAIQIDIASFGGAGTTREKFISDKSRKALWSSIYDLSMFDNSSSTNITINNNKFTSYYGYSGEAIIKGTGEKVLRPYGPSVGSHSKSLIDSYKNINIINNTFYNTIKPNMEYSKGLKDDRKFYPIHMYNTNMNELLKTLNVKNNKFIDTERNYKFENGSFLDNWIGFYGLPIDEKDNNLYYNSLDGKVPLKEYKIENLLDKYIEEQKYGSPPNLELLKIEDDPRGSINGFKNILYDSYFNKEDFISEIRNIINKLKNQM